MQAIFDWFQETVGLLLIEAAIRVLPKDTSPREGVMRGLKEQRQYDRYEGYTRLMDSKPLPFERWREVWGWTKLKAAAR